LTKSLHFDIMPITFQAFVSELIHFEFILLVFIAKALTLLLKIELTFIILYQQSSLLFYI